jgi:hypothetical protein
MGQRAKETKPFSRAVAQAQYNRGQACLAEAGLDSVVVYGGVRWDIDEDTGPESGLKLPTSVPSPSCSTRPRGRLGRA